MIFKHCEQMKPHLEKSLGYIWEKVFFVIVADANEIKNA